MAYSEEDNSTLRLLSASFVIQVRSMTHGSFFTHVVMNETVLIGFLKPFFSLLLGSLDVNKEFILHLYCSFLGTTNFMRGPPSPQKNPRRRWEEGVGLVFFAVILLCTVNLSKGGCLDKAYGNFWGGHS